MFKALTTFRRGELDLSVLGWWKCARQDFIGALTGIWDVQPFYFPGTIHNSTNMKRGDIRADLTVYTREEMLEIVSNLISAIAGDYLLENDLEFDDIPYICLSDPEMRIADGDAAKCVALNRLADIVNNFRNSDSSQSASVRDFCGRLNQIVTDATMLLQFVDCNNGRRIDDPLRKKYRRYLAVKRIDLYTHFSLTDFTIAFAIDIPDDGYEMTAIRSLAKTDGKDAVIYIDSTTWDGVRKNHVEVFHQMRRMGANPQKRLYYVRRKGLLPAWADMGVWKLRDVELGAGASAMFLIVEIVIASPDFRQIFS